MKLIKSSALLITLILGMQTIFAMECEDKVKTDPTQEQAVSSLTTLPPEILWNIIQTIDPESPQEFLQELANLRETNTFFHNLLNHETMVLFLKAKGYTPEQLSSFFQILLTSDTTSDNSAIWVRILLEAGVDVNMQNQDGRTALMYAVLKNRDNIVQLLLNQGAHVNMKNQYGGTALTIAARNGHRDTVQLLIQEGANVNMPTEDGTTALMLAAQEGHASVVELLLNYGADVNMRDQQGRTALDYALQMMRNREGLTALNYALQDNHLGIVHRINTHIAQQQNNASQ